MSIKWPLNKFQSSSIAIRNCQFTDEPIILQDDGKDSLVLMDSRVFAKAYGFMTLHYDMQHIFEAEGMGNYVLSTQIQKTATLINICKRLTKPVVIKRYGRDVVVAMTPAEFEKRATYFESDVILSMHK